ncbi:acetate--CoA ligase family protein [Sporosarcina sp. CAU 1771]
MTSSQLVEILTEVESRTILDKYKIPQNKYKFTTCLEDTLNEAKKLTYPLVMKVVSKKIVHKSDFGGVQINLKNEKEVENAYKKIFNNASLNNISAEEIDGVTIQEMEKGIEEILIGVKRDPVFGPVIVVGFGGILVEIMKDISLGITPLAEKDIYKMLRKLKGFSLLDGFRGSAKADLSSIVEIVLKVQEMIINEPKILELDINPLIVKEAGRGSIAVDARIVMG